MPSPISYYSPSSPLSVTLLQGQGGPDGDLPWYTKSVVLLTGVFSIGMFAIPASMLTWGFEAEAERLAARAISKARKKRAGEVSSAASSSSSSSAYSRLWGGASNSDSIDTSDEEYQNVIAGGADDEKDDEVVALFSAADADRSGSLTKDEFIRLMAELAKSKSQSLGDGGSPDEALQRIERLETIVNAMDKKLDHILQAMHTA